MLDIYTLYLFFLPLFSQSQASVSSVFFLCGDKYGSYMLSSSNQFITINYLGLKKNQLHMSKIKFFLLPRSWFPCVSLCSSQEENRRKLPNGAILPVQFQTVTLVTEKNKNNKAKLTLQPKGDGASSLIVRNFMHRFGSL